MLTNAASRSFVARTRPFISVQGAVMPFKGVTLAFAKRRRESNYFLLPKFEDHGPGLSS